MATVKMQYGIDLGTTNSSICKMEDGVPTIIKTDTLKDTLPSCVAFTSKKIIKVGDSAFNNNRSDKSRATKHWDQSNSNVFLEFKRTMGLDKEYYSSNMDRGYTSEELSSEVLKALVNFTHTNIDSAVITIPAKFKSDQISATKRAAELAGLKHTELLQEPIAAAIAYGLKADQTDGKWLVFDFGGGTFDAALLRVEDGILQVKDTEGDNYLGGKNLDYAIVDQILIPELSNNYNLSSILSDENKKNILRDALKFYAETAKNQLSFNNEVDITSQLDEFGEDDDGEPIELDLVITLNQVKEAITPIFQKAVDICKVLLERNNLKGENLDSLILVGGPTRSPILRNLLKEQITVNVNTNIDPMTAIAIGASLYASTVDTSIEIDHSKINEQTIELELQYDSNSVEETEYVAIKISDNCPTEKIHLEVKRNDGAWSSGRKEIDKVGDVVECNLIPNKPNGFKISCFNSDGSIVQCFPNEFSIIQGTKIGNAVLPYNIGIEVHDEKKDQDVFIPFKGLEKNQNLPAIGVKNGLLSPKAINVGNANDRLVIPVYQGEFNAEGTRAIYNDHVFDVVITGKDLNTSIPDNSQIDITIKVDKSQMMVLEAQIISTGETIEKSIQIESRTCIAADELQNQIYQLKEKYQQLESTLADHNELNNSRKLIQEIDERYNVESNSEDGRMHLLSDIRKSFIELDQIEERHADETLNAEINEIMDKIKKCNDLLGNKYNSEVNQAQNIANKALITTDNNKKRQHLQSLYDLHMKITLKFQIFNIARDFVQKFDSFKWTNVTSARNLVNNLNELLIKEPFGDEIAIITTKLLSLLADKEQSEKLKLV